MLRKRFFNNRFISSLLIFCFVFATMIYALPVYAVDTITDAEAINLNENIETDKIIGNIYELTVEDVPEIISFAKAKANGHIARLREKETDRNTVIFLNEDKTETMYIFAEPIKYTDSYGDVRDKSTELTLDGTNYIMQDNDINVTLPLNISQGISVSDDEISISMTPLVMNIDSEEGALSSLNSKDLSVTAPTSNDNKIIYSDVFGNGINIQYTPLYTGLKEDIILESYTDVSGFSFTVNTNGLYPVLNFNGSVSFYDPSTDIVKAKMMQVVCIDANGSFAGGEVQITQLKQNQRYIFTIIPDAEFLASEDTVYPVAVDPTITLNTETAIEDAVIYSGKPNKNYETYSYNNIGYVDDTYQIGELFIKFPTLADNTVFSSLSEDDISIATLSLYTASSGNGTEVIEVYQYNYGTWAENTVTWNSVDYMVPPTLISSSTIPKSGGVEAQFDITAAVKEWASDDAYVTPDRGVLLINDDNTDPDQCRDFLSTEYSIAKNNPDVMPTLVIDYNVDISDSILDLEIGASQTLSITDTSAESVTWTSNKLNVASVSSSGVVTALRAGTATVTATVTYSTGATKVFTCTIYVHFPAGVYYIRNSNAGYRLTVEEAKINHLSAVNISANKTYTASDPAIGLSQMWKVSYHGQNKYRFAPMHRMEYYLYGDLTLVAMGHSTNSSNITWSVDFCTYGYTVRRNGLNLYTLQTKSSSTSVPAEIWANTYSTNTSAQWTFSEITDPPHGLLLYNTDTQKVVTATSDNPATVYVALEETRTLSEQNLLTSVYANNMSAQNLSWSEISGSGDVTVNSSGKVTGVAVGSRLIRGRRYIKDAWKEIYINVVITPVVEGIYVMKNKQTGRSADIENQTMSNGTTIHQWKLHGGNTQRWQIIHVIDGYYSIRSLNGTSYYMGVSDDSTELNADIVLRNGEISDGMKWRIETTSSGAYKLIPKTGISNDYVLATSSSSTENGEKLIQGAYVLNDSYRDEWNLIRMLPTNGYELDYNESLWDGEVESKCNCYAYAINSQVYPGTNDFWSSRSEYAYQQPGLYAGYNMSVRDDLYEEKLYDYVLQDYQTYNENFSTSLVFQRIGQYETCPAGTYKVALVVDKIGPLFDYHWYRQDSDGLWSHKRGNDHVKRTDESNSDESNSDAIIDPYYADRGEYTIFLGYYAVSPWNNYYNSSASANSEEESEILIMTSDGELLSNIEYEEEKQ